MLRMLSSALATVRSVSFCVVSKNLHGICLGDGFFPSAGFRHHSSAVPTNVGSNGYVWSLSPSGTSSSFLYFGSPNVYFTSVYRAFGFILRCVQELTWDLFGDGFFPVAGFRNNSTGASTTVGANGYYWSSSVSAQYSWWLEFQSSYAFMYAYSRSRGFALRCVQAFTGSVSGWFFPAAGYRSREAGTPSAVGSNCNVWSSCVSGTVAGYAYFSDPVVCLQFGSRGYSLSLRCVQAFTGSVSGFFFPSAGYRTLETGTQVSGGSWGVYCASSPMGISGCYLELQPATCYLRFNHRSFGFSLRCVQAFTGSVCREVFFPSAGYRHIASGTPTNVGAEGFVWSPICVDASGFRLVFNRSLIASEGSYRAFGFSLRCVQEFARNLFRDSSSRLRDTVLIRRECR